MYVLFFEVNNDVFYVLGVKFVQQVIVLYLILQNVDVIKSELDSYVVIYFNIKDCVKDVGEFGLDFFIMVGKGVEMINLRI